MVFLEVGRAGWRRGNAPYSYSGGPCSNLGSDIAYPDTHSCTHAHTLLKYAKTYSWPCVKITEDNAAFCKLTRILKHNFIKKERHVKSSVFWDVTSCSLIEGYHPFDGTYVNREDGDSIFLRNCDNWPLQDFISRKIAVETSNLK
jgi:hypothetical protein